MGEQEVGWASPIHEAVWQNKLSEVIELLKSPDTDVESVVEECTPLYIACLKGYTDIADALITQGHAKVNGDSPPIFAAAGKGNLELVKLLLKHSADPSACSSQHAGCCGLHIAAEKNFVDVVKCLLDAKVDVNIRSEKQNLTPLISAACCGSIDAVSLLLDNGADINAQSSTGNTALMLAIDRGKIDVAKLLVNRGANLEIKGQKGWTALHNAASGGERGYIEVAEMLLDHGAKIDAQSETMLTPLHEAAGKSLVEIVELLVKRGANVNAKDKFWNTPLRMCASNAQAFAQFDTFKKTVEILLDAKADINAGTTINTTSLHSVVKWGNVDAVKFMLEKGANPNIRTEKGELPLDFCKDPEVRAILLPVTKVASSQPSSSSSSPSPASKSTQGSFGPDSWQPDSAVSKCNYCNKGFTLLVRKHHCRNCGLIYCGDCTAHRVSLPDKGHKEAVRVCTKCANGRK